MKPDGRNYMQFLLRVPILSNPDAAVAGCELPNLYENGNYHIFFVIDLPFNLA
ncbi:MAG: hypothetical protein GXX78_14700 [Bacteroidales bacterium]|nr:hypothetical protein [Bacteroidales bacterium]